MKDLVQLQLGVNPQITKPPFDMTNTPNLLALDIGFTGINLMDLKLPKKLVFISAD